MTEELNVDTGSEPARNIPTWATPRRDELRVPPVLLPYQQAWIADQADVKIFEKSRRVGISWAEAADAVLYAAAASGDDVWYIGYNREMAMEFILDCGMWSRKFQSFVAAIEETEETFTNAKVVDGAPIIEEQKILAYRITFESGNRITALSSRPNNLRGKQGRVIIDEAAFHDNLAGLIKAAIALLMWGGQVRIISTHFGDTNEFNEIIQEIRAGRLDYSLHRCTLDDALEQGLFKRICLVRGIEWSEAAEAEWRQKLVNYYRGNADEELFCIPSQGTGNYIARVLIEKCMNEALPVLAWACSNEFALRSDEERKAEALDWCKERLLPLLDLLPKDRKHCFGEDFARSANLTVLYPATIKINLHLRVPFVVELFNVPFREQELICFYILDRLPRFQHGAFDGRGNGQYLSERAMQRYGTGRITQVMLTETWYREQMPKWKAQWEDGTIEAPKNSEHLDDYRAVKMVRGVPKIPDKTTGKGEENSNIIRHGDAAIASCMMVFASTQNSGGQYAYESVSSNKDDNNHRPGRAGSSSKKGLW